MPQTVSRRPAAALALALALGAGPAPAERVADGTAFREDFEP